MALVCPACGTENRSVAKFCIECISLLPAEFEPTQLAAPPPEPQEAMPSALAAFAAAAPSSTPLPPLWDMPVSAAPPPPRHGIWTGLAMAGMLLMGAVGWLAAGGTLWPADSEVRALPIEATVPAAASAPAQLPPAQAPPAEPEPAAVPSPTPTVRQARPERLFGRCDGLGFVAASRCKVEQCTKSANRRRAECQPVLAHQRLMEEKRNPTLSN
ncbi:MAG TPA: zinc ribbon domain-containing protein [Variovorax sp.]|nr:zinc ribbon domain-containing protein [Variovorax sp.]